MELSAFENLLTTDGTFFGEESRRLTAIAVEMGVPTSEIEDVVAEVWLEAVKYRHRFVNGEVELSLSCWLTYVVRSKAVDLLRHRGCCPCESLAAAGIDFIDDGKAKREKVAELREWLDVLLEKVCKGNEESLLLLCLHFFQGFSIRDLAREFSIKACAVEGRIRRLLKKLRQRAKWCPA